MPSPLRRVAFSMGGSAQAICRWTLLFTLTTTLSGIAFGEQPSDTSPFVTDPATGIVYRRVVRTVSRPVVQERMTQKQQTIYQPKKIVESRPVKQRIYTPVTQFRLQPKVEGRWNPFRQPTVAYHHVPETRWQAQDLTLSETTTRVEWTPETQTVAVPEKELRMQSEQQVAYEPVGRVDLSPTSSVASPPAGVSAEVAARLRPLASNAKVQSLGSSSVSSTTLAELDSRHTRTTLQSGLRATELSPGGSTWSTPVSGSSTGIAGLPSLRIWR